MSASLSLFSLTIAAGDPTPNNNPSLRYVDWKRQIQAIEVENPKTEGRSVAPGASELIFDGTRTTSIDGTTAFDLSLSPLAPDRYRITASGGTSPAFRTDRGLSLTGLVLTLTAQSNGSLLVASGSGSPFSALQVGDEVFVIGLMTGDVSSPFNVLNQGQWTVLGTGSSGANVTLSRPSGTDFQGYSEIVTPASDLQMIGFSAGGVQIGDKVDLVSGFAAPALKTVEVLEVTPKWVEFISTTPLAAQAGVTPGASGLKVYTSSKRYVRIEADQECVVQANGDTGFTQRMSPWAPGDPAQVAEYTKTGATWSLTVVNRSSATLHLTVISAE